MTIGTILLLILALNAISCIIARIIQGGKFEIELPEEKHIYSGASKMLILLAGSMSQPEDDFAFIESIKEKEQAVNAVLRPRYSMFGWHADNSARQLDQLIRETYTDQVEVYTRECGDKVVRLMNSEKIEKIFAINPCPVPSTLKERKKVRTEAIVLQLVSFLVGWISIIPIFRAGSGRYSLALTADKMWEISTNDSPQPTRVQRTYIVLSEEEQYLDNVSILRFYEAANLRKDYNDLRMERVKYVKAPWVTSMDIGYTMEYDKALRELDQEKPTQLSEFAAERA